MEALLHLLFLSPFQSPSMPLTVALRKDDRKSAAVAERTLRSEDGARKPSERRRRGARSETVSSREAKISHSRSFKKNSSETPATKSSKRVFVTVSGYPEGEWTEDAIESIFGRYGKIKSIHILQNMWSILFEDDDAKKEAVEALDGAVIEIIANGEEREGTLDVRLYAGSKKPRKKFGRGA